MLDFKIISYNRNPIKNVYSAHTFLLPFIFDEALTNKSSSIELSRIQIHKEKSHITKIIPKAIKSSAPDVYIKVSWQIREFAPKRQLCCHFCDKSVLILTHSNTLGEVSKNFMQKNLYIPSEKMC